MFAIIETGGKQYKVSEGDVLFIEKLDVEAESEVVFDKVLMVNEKIGTPYVDGAKVKAGNPVIKDVVVKAKVVAHVQDKKIVVYKYKPKKNERKKQGHRQPYTKITIESIG